MVAMIEIAFLIVCVVLGLRWWTRTNLYRAQRRSPAVWTGADMSYRRHLPNQKPIPPAHPGDEE